MTAAETEKLRLRKELEKYFALIRLWKKEDLVTGRWFAKFVDRTLGSMSSAPTPPEVRERWKGAATPDDLARKILHTTIHETLTAADCLPENLTVTEIKRLREKGGGDQKLTGDILPLLAEVLHGLKGAVDMIFNMAAGYEKTLTADQADLFTEAFGRSLGGFDFEKAKEEGLPLEAIGAKIFDRAVVQPLDSPLGEAQRKGFYVHYAKCIAREAKGLVERLPNWEPPPKGEPGGEGMTATPPADDEALAAY